jgi:hypothetical protein
MLGDGIANLKNLLQLSINLGNNSADDYGLQFFIKGLFNL